MKSPKLKIPAKLGACADMIYNLRTERLALEAEAEEIKKSETLLKEHLIDKLGAEQAAEGIVGEVATVRVLSDVQPIIQDWEALARYVVENDAVDLLQRRLSGPAVSARWELGKAVPGIDKLMVTKLSITKR